ncbi:MAG: hypothetical protein EOP85_12970 [Verrucomicrobiaceae bacterium]|nr:MAG: hypothetical protein EOP85_12970 [Verrucomicrobiaceae bacterium]
MKPAVPITVPIALLQMMFVVVGVLMTRFTLSASGHPAENVAWNPVSVFIRNHGYLLLLLPLTWSITALWMERETLPWPRALTIVSGVAPLTLLGFLFWHGAASPSTGKRFITTSS